ncbi:hypothetical protein RHGRI_020561 [Rhododendron griersonianum]|uniref:Uncharacterized protein n=1 Tax=Rhododendron griersonianum TaxID=479676 RepID=A0AAV6JK19_9ERIC|nr:hypothetical protein RHGRI_020561 [Rhododendron griersonianum]
MTPAKRNNPDSTPPPPLRRSKRLAQCKDVAIPVDQSTDGRGDEETNVSYSGDSYEEMSKSVSQVDTESDSDGETYDESESDCHSGALKLPNLSAFAKRPIIEEMSVALGKLRKITHVSQLLKDLGLHPICKYEGRQIGPLLGNFLQGSIHSRLTSWPPEETETEDNPFPKIRLNILKKDFVLLHHIFWWNVYPKSPHHELNGPGTIGKSEGQSKLHREVNNPASLEGLRDMILTVQENQISMWEKLKKVEHAVCPDDDEVQDSFDDE